MEGPSPIDALLEVLTTYPVMMMIPFLRIVAAGYLSMKVYPNVFEKE